MALDPRLASPLLLALAAQRLTQRQGTQSDPVVWLTMDGEPEDPEAAGQIYLPRKCASAEEWYTSPLIAGMRATLRQPGDGAC
jgi:hypothetical protein